MGRIDEALRRAGALPARDSGPTGERDDLFVAAWSLGNEATEEAPGAKIAGSQEFDGGSLEAAPRLRGVRPALFDRLKTGWKERLSGSKDCDPGLSDQFRQLAATLFHSRRVDGVKTVMVTSAVPSDGKTLVALNLALVLSESYRHRVLLIDADLRRPSIGEALNIRTDEGLSEALRRGKKASLVALSETLMLLPAGRPDPDPLSGLASPGMQNFLEEAAGRFDWVIVDTPPVGAASDAGLLCPMVHAALLVVRARQTPYAAIQRAIEALGRERILGVVLNGVEHRKTPDYYNYYHKQQSGLGR